MECNAEQYRHDAQYDENRRSILTLGWQQFVKVQEETNTSLTLEFLVNGPERENGVVFIRKNKISVTAEIINMMYWVQDFTDAEEQLLVEERAGMNRARFSHVLGYPGYHIHDNHIMLRKELNWIAKAWNIFLSAHCLPTKNMARVEYYRLRYIYAIRQGYNVDLGKMIINSLDNITQAYFAGGVGLCGIITHICQMNRIADHPTDVYMPCGR